MLLQTLLQLNLLILATPALAGWSALPIYHGNVGIVGVVWQYRVAKAALPVVEVLQPALQAKTPIALPVPTAVCVLVIPPAAALISLCPFPHAARAP